MDIWHSKCVKPFKACINLFDVFLGFSRNVWQTSWEYWRCAARTSDRPLTRLTANRFIWVFWVRTSRVLTSTSWKFLSFLLICLKRRVQARSWILFTLSKARALVIYIACKFLCWGVQLHTRLPTISASSLFFLTSLTMCRLITANSLVRLGLVWWGVIQLIIMRILSNSILEPLVQLIILFDCDLSTLLLFLHFFHFY